MQEYDVIVIGSGIGGLSSAAMLAFMGKKVLVLEKDKAPGGSMQTISRDPWQWSYGLQYLALFCAKLGPFDFKEEEILPFLTSPPVKFDRISPAIKNAFQTLTFPDLTGDKKFYLIADKESMLNYLKEEFPDASEAFDTYWSYISIFEKNLFNLMMPKMMPAFFSKVMFPYFTKELKHIMKLDYDELVTSLFSHSKDFEVIQRIFYTNWSFLGFPPQTNALFWLIGHSLQLHGIFVPEGGAISLTNGFINFIRERGGDIKTAGEGEVQNLIIKGFPSRCTGVETKDGKQWFARDVISSIGLPGSLKLAPRRHFAGRVKRAVKSHISMPTNMLLRVGLDPSLTREELDNSIDDTTYRTVKDKAWLLNDDPTREDWDPAELLILFPHFYDGSKDTPQTAEIISFSNSQAFFSSFSGKDDPGYQAAVENITGVMLKKFRERFPVLAEKVAFHEFTGPFDIGEKLSHNQNSMYGLDSYKLFDMRILPNLGVRHFYLTGEDLFSQGINISNGMLTVQKMMLNDLIKTGIKKGFGLGIRLPWLILRAFFPTSRRLKLPKSLRKEFADR